MEYDFYCNNETQKIKSVFITCFFFFDFYGLSYNVLIKLVASTVCVCVFFANLAPYFAIVAWGGTNRTAYGGYFILQMRQIK